MATCLGIAALLGIHATSTVDAAIPDPPRVALVAGEIYDSSACHDACLRLPLYNAGDAPVRITGFRFDDGRGRTTVTATDVEPLTVEPRTWGLVRFDLSMGCSASPPGEAAGTVRVTLAEKGQRLVLRLPEATGLLARYQRMQCPRGTPANLEDITGSWVREDVQGVWRGLEGRELMQFSTDGRFSWSFVNGPYRHVSGRYTLTHGALRVTLDRSSLCDPGETYTWRATLLGHRLLHLAAPPSTIDTCGPSTRMWVAHKVVVPARGPDPRRLTPR